MNAETQVLLWSATQRALRVASVRDMLYDNVAAYEAGRPNDWIVLGFGGIDAMTQAKRDLESVSVHHRGGGAECAP